MMFSFKNLLCHVPYLVEQTSDTLLLLKPNITLHQQNEHFNMAPNKLKKIVAINNRLLKSTITTTTHNCICQNTTKKSSEDNETIKMSPNDYTMTATNNHNHSHQIDEHNLSIDNNSNIKYLVDLYTATLHLRQRMREENLIHRSYAAYLNDKTSPRSLFHNCFHSYETIEWLMKKQLCKTPDDGLEIFQVLEKLKIIHHVCDLNEFEYPSSGSSSISNVKYLYRFRLDDGTADLNRSFQQFASIYETYTSLFTLDRSQCRGVDLQQQIPLTDPYSEQPGIALKGDNLGRMIALRSGTNMQNVERLADDMMMYGLVRFDECDQQPECCCSTNKFHNDSNHQYVLSNSHRLLADKRLDLIALMQHNSLLLSSPIDHSPPTIRNSSNSFVSASCPDRSPSINQVQSKTFLNRTLSSYYCNDSLSKLSPLLPPNNCCHQYYPRILPSNDTFHSSSLMQQTNGRRHLISGPTSSNSSLVSDDPQGNRRISNGDELDCTTKLTCTVTNNEGFRRKKSASLNSPANSETRPTADELERLELPWCWKSYSLKRDRRGYGLILHGQGPCYVERLDPYGSAYTSGIRINEYIYAIEGVNVLRRSGKEVERLLSMFDKCTIYTVYNRDDFCQISTPPNEYHTNRMYPIKQPSSLSSSLNDYNNNASTLLATLNLHSLNQQPAPYSSSPQNQQNSSPTSSIDGASSCSISPRQFSTTNKKGILAKHFNMLKFNSRTCTNSSSTNALK